MPRKFLLLTCRRDYPWYLLILLQLSLMTLITYSYSLSNWARSSEVSLGAFIVKSSTTEKNILKEDTCDDSSLSESLLCERFFSLRKTLTPMLLSLLSADLLLLLWVLTSVSFLFSWNFYRTGCALGFFITFSLSSGPLMWLVEQKVQMAPCKSFEVECKSIDKGFMVNLAVVLLSIFTHSFFFIVGRVSINVNRVGAMRVSQLNSQYSTVRNYSDTKAVTSNFN
jgi:hypothetical protein